MLSNPKDPRFWENAEPAVLLNPRFPAEERARLDRRVAALPPFEDHVWLATSGTSGPVKLVALSRRAILASAAAVNHHLRATAADTWLHVLPLFHVGGLGILARARLTGSRVHGEHDHGGMPPPWSAERFVTAVRESQATLSALVPAQVHDLVSDSHAAPPGLRAVVVGGGALPDILYQRARALSWPLLPSYGATECASQIATASLTSLDRPGFPDLPLLPHVKARETEDGYLAFQSAALFTAYASEPTDGHTVVLEDPKQDGWWTSEDRGQVRDDESLVVAGRDTDFVKIGGENVYLPRLEAVLQAARMEQAFPGDVALVAAPDARLGHVVILVTSGADGPARDALRHAFNARVLPFERARAVHDLAINPPHSARQAPARGDPPAARCVVTGSGVPLIMVLTVSVSVSVSASESGSQSVSQILRCRRYAPPRKISCFCAEGAKAKNRGLRPHEAMRSRTRPARAPELAARVITCNVHVHVQVECPTSKVKRTK